MTSKQKMQMIFFSQKLLLKEHKIVKKTSQQRMTYDAKRLFAEVYVYKLTYTITVESPVEVDRWG